MMKRKLFFVCLLLFSVAALASYEDINAVRIHGKSGENVTILLDDNPVVRFEDSDLVVTTHMNVINDAEPHYYLLEYAVHTCPDNNHPHAIDLGLPSGTKWCCCNVGASAPEEYGGYYAWGETSEKSVYNWDTYAFCSNSTGYVNIGTDISGTQYDVAHVRMGAPWRMPTHEQQVELMENCTRQWTQQNGVNGILVTGTNGGQVFFPAGGFRWNDDLSYVGSFGFFWSSSLFPNYGDSGAYYLYFYSGFWGWSYYSRYNGHSVRSVCPYSELVHP